MQNSAAIDQGIHINTYCEACCRGTMRAKRQFVGAFKKTYLTTTNLELLSTMRLPSALAKMCLAVFARGW